MVWRSRFKAEGVGSDITVTREGIYRVLVDLVPGETRASLRPFKLDYCCMPQQHASNRPVQRLHAFANGATIEAMRKVGRHFEVLANAAVESRAAIDALPPPDTDRFDGGKRGPELIGRLI